MLIFQGVKFDEFSLRSYMKRDGEVGHMQNCHADDTLMGGQTASGWQFS